MAAEWPLSPWLAMAMDLMRSSPTKASPRHPILVSLGKAIVAEVVRASSPLPQATRWIFNLAKLRGNI